MCPGAGVISVAQWSGDGRAQWVRLRKKTPLAVAYLVDFAGAALALSGPIVLAWSRGGVLPRGPA